MNMSTNTDSTTDNLLAALIELSTATHQPPVITYRVYYDKTTGICSHKTIEEPPPEGAFVEVSQEQYEEMAFCPQWAIKNHKPVLIPVDSSPTIMLKCDNTAEGWKTIHDNMVFRVTDAQRNEDLDTWILRTYNDE